MDQQKLMEKIFGALGKKYGEAAVTTLEAGHASNIKAVIPTGIEVVDHYILGIGGLPTGRIIEIFGPESSGKSSFVISCLAQVQRIGGLGIYCDAEHVFTTGRAQLFGVNPGALIMIDPDNAEHAGKMIITALQALPDDGAPVLIVWDSIPALLTQSELEGEVGDAHMAPIARFLSKFCGHLVKLLGQKNACMLFVNQTRSAIGVMYGNPEVTPGGKALKFFTSARLRFKAGKVDDGKLNGGVKCVKNKLSEPMREVETQLNFKSGWNNEWATINHAKDLGLVPKDARASGKAYDAARAALEAHGWPPQAPTVAAEEKPKRAKKAAAE